MLGWLEPQKIRTLLAALPEKYDLILMDLPAMLEVADAGALACLASGCILIVDTDSSLNDLERLHQETQRLGVQPLGYILNRA